MDIKKAHEKAAAEQFIDWYNDRYRRHLTLTEQGEALDVRFSDAIGEPGVEVRTAWYDQQHAAWAGRHARDDPTAPESMTVVNPNRNLTDWIGQAVVGKAAHRFDIECVLLVAVYPPLTSADELEALLPSIELPAGHPFAGVYVAGHFPASASTPGGYRCWCISSGTTS